MQPVPSGTPALRFLCLSDTHDLQADMPLGTALPAADILIHSGDFTCTGRREEIESFNAWLDNLLAAGTVRHAVLVAGNHECTLALTAKHPAARQGQIALKRSLTEGRDNVHYLEDSGCEVLTTDY